jgi:hypothetical protein
MDNINQKLESLYEILVDELKVFTAELMELIFNPDKINDTNKFASLLVALKRFELINPLLETISLGNKGDSWLCDFLYAASGLLEESSMDDEFEVPGSLVLKLEDWILNNTGQLSWYAAGLLKFYESESAEKIQLQKLEQRGDFFLTYAECILGLLRYHRDKYMALVSEIANDETRDEKLRELCREIIESEPGNQDFADIYICRIAFLCLIRTALIAAQR